MMGEPNDKPIAELLDEIDEVIRTVPTREGTFKFLENSTQYVDRLVRELRERLDFENKADAAQDRIAALAEGYKQRAETAERELRERIEREQRWQSCGVASDDPRVVQIIFETPTSASLFVDRFSQTITTEAKD